MHHFLQRVGQGNEFFSTDFTDAGEKLFSKAVAKGLFEQTSGPQGLARYTKWRVTGDPSYLHR
jgi:hypothetical protein